MAFVVHIAVGAPIVVEDGNFTVQDNGTLLVGDKERGRLTTYSPVGWLKVEEDLPGPRPVQMPQRIR